VLDSRTGLVVGGVAAECCGYLLNDNGNELYAMVSSGQGVVVQRFEVLTGTLLAQSEALPGAGTALAHDARTGRLVAITSLGVVVMDGDTLMRLGGFPAPLNASPSQLVMDPQKPEAYIVWDTGRLGAARNILTLVNTETFVTIAEAVLPGDQSVSGMVLGPRPPRAMNLVSTQAGGTVTLQWANETTGSMSTGLLVEAGSSPGGSDLATLPVTTGETTLVVPGVPPGTYYVRVRAVNGTGIGAASNEVVVVIP
jgi:hypothetical protein